MRLVHRVFLVNLLVHEHTHTHTHTHTLKSRPNIDTHLSSWLCSSFCWIAGLAPLSLSFSAALRFFDKSSTSELRKQIQTSQKEENQIRNIQAGNQNKVCRPTKNYSSVFFLSYFLSLLPLSLALQQLICPFGSLVQYNNLQMHSGEKNGMSCRDS